MYWAVIKASLRDPAIEPRFNDWYNRVHVPEYVGYPGFRRGWRIERIERRNMSADAPRPDVRDQKFMAIYEVDHIDSFNDALRRTQERGLHAWEEWSQHIVDWQRTYYRVLHSEGDRLKADRDVVGRYWTIARASLDAKDAADEREFNEWYSQTHVPDVVASPGMRRAWRLEAVPHDNQVGQVDHKYWAVYESDGIHDVPKSREGKVPWAGRWNAQIRHWDILFCKVLCQDLSGPAW